MNQLTLNFCLAPTKPDILAMFKCLNQKHFDDEITGVRVVWNKRLKAAAGRCRFRNIYGDKIPFEIDLAEKIFEADGWKIHKVERTLIHEMVHAYLLITCGDTTHGPRFQRMMTEITGDNRNHTVAHDLERITKYKYNVVCRNHGVLGQRMRKGARYIVCKKCRVQVTYEPIKKL